MAAPLLGIKLHIPSPRPGMVPRPHLVARLSAGLGARKLTLISAPAGFGKTTLLSEWVHTMAGLLLGSRAEATLSWPMLGIAAAAVSLVAIVPWARVVPPGAWPGAVLDLLILLALLPPRSAQIVAALP